ncbi:putative kinase [Mayamaea pseudoterrestris]|nr:putative kinase [Mayamaea pseudoterrestris]
MGQHRRQPSNSDYTKTWEPMVAETIRQKMDHIINAERPYMLGLIGIPGSGKTISAMVLANILEQTYNIQCFIAPHDGYHYPLQHLRVAHSDADDIIYRRGAPETLDAEALARDLRRIRNGDEAIISLPGFDHAKGDPEPDQHVFDRSRHKVVLCEGLYLLHDRDGWQDVESFFDWKIFIDADIDECMQRLAVRNQCIPGYSPEEILIRVEKVDRVNALTVVESKDRADLVVESLLKTIHSPPLKSTMHKKQLSSSMSLLTSAELADIVGGSSDWAMDIGSRPRSDSMQAGHLSPFKPNALSRRDRSDSVKSDHQQAEKPVGKFVGSWEKDMAMRIKKMSEETNRSPLMVAVVAGPGSGKSVSAMLLANHLEQMHLPCMIMPHDGYHYPLDYLRTFPNPQDAIYRRGAPDTFDPHALVRDLVRIRDGQEEVIKVPAFDHARADPEPDTHVFDRHVHKVVICEGLYLLHDSDGWESVPGMFDLRIFMEADLDSCMERIKIRNQCIPGYSPEEIAERAEAVDRVNFLTVIHSKINADVCVSSKC